MVEKATTDVKELEVRPQKPQLVIIGGGSGTSNLVEKSRPLLDDISVSVICTTVDEGGSTGVLQKILVHPSEVAPLGDVRQILYALRPKDADSLLWKLWNLRSKPQNGEKTWDNHPYGNITIAYAIQYTGSFEKAIEWLAKDLAIRGDLIPVTLRTSRLWVETASGEKLVGEHVIDSLWTQDPRNRVVDIGLTEGVPLNSKAKEAIEKADVIALGPGSHYTSLMANLLVDGMCEEIRHAQERGAEVIYIAPIFAELGHGEPYGASASVRLRDIVERGIKPDKIVVNTGRVPKRMRSAYKREWKYPVECDKADQIQCKRVASGIEIIQGNFIEITEDHRFRHNSRLAETVYGFLQARKPAV